MEISWGCVAILLALSCLLMIVLKLFDVIDWSWWCVFAPIYLPLIAAMCLFFVVMGDLMKNGWH